MRHILRLKEGTVSFLKATLLWLTYKELYIFNIYSLVRLEISMHSWNHHHNQGHESIYHLQKFLPTPLFLLSFVVRTQCKIFPLIKIFTTQYSIVTIGPMLYSRSRTYSSCSTEICIFELTSTPFQHTPASFNHEYSLF